MEIQFYNEDISSFKFDHKQSERYLIELVKEEGKTIGVLSIIFCSDKYLLKMNQEHLNHDYYTDVITFDYCEEGIVSGDIFISIDRIKDNAKKYEVEFLNELYRVIFHGVLHLAGYKDKTEKDQREMRGKENFYLNKLLGE